jgi:hypothetical protein
MVSQIEAAKASGISAVIVTAGHGTAHYLVGGMSELSDPAVMAGGLTVFGLTFAVSYGGMRGLF